MAVILNAFHSEEEKNEKNSYFYCCLCCLLVCCMVFRKIEVYLIIKMCCRHERRVPITCPSNLGIMTIQQPLPLIFLKSRLFALLVNCSRSLCWLSFNTRSKLLDLVVLFGECVTNLPSLVPASFYYSTIKRADFQYDFGVESRE